jgi:uncharacterized C2H2 Zn-finger protein
MGRNSIAWSCEEQGLQRIRVYTVDLTETGRAGEFKCPRCGAEMSPDDETDEVYAILETVRKGNSLERVVLRCNRCESQIHLVGFRSALDAVSVH